MRPYPIALAPGKLPVCASILADRVILMAFVGLVISVVEDHIAVLFEGQNVSRDLVEELTIVGHDDHAAGVVRDALFEYAKSL